jgi:hypothetical protein
MLGIRNWIKQVRRKKYVDSQSYKHLKLNPQKNEDKKMKNLEDK